MNGQCGADIQAKALEYIQTLLYFTEVTQRMHVEDARLQLFMRLLDCFPTGLAFPHMVVPPKRLELVAVEQEQASSCIGKKVL